MWDKAKEQEFQCLIGSVQFQDLLQKATEEMTLDTDMALDSFVGCLKAAGKCMVKKHSCGVRSIIKKAEWFNEEYKEHKTNVKRLLKQYKRNRSEESRQSHTNANKVYRNLVTQKKNHT